MHTTIHHTQPIMYTKKFTCTLIINVVIKNNNKTFISIKMNKH